MAIFTELFKDRINKEERLIDLEFVGLTSNLYLSFSTMAGESRQNSHEDSQKSIVYCGRSS